MLDRLHWSAAAPAIKDVSVRSNSSEQEVCSYPQQRVTQDAAALLARTGHTATACGRLMVLIGGDFRDGPALDALDVAVLELDQCRIVQPRLHGQQPPSLQHHCTVRLVLEEGNALREQVGRLMGISRPCPLLRTCASLWRTPLMQCSLNAGCMGEGVGIADRSPQHIALF